MGALAGSNLKGWTFFYETPFEQLPFTFEWKDAAEEEKQVKRRPDGVAWNAIERTVLFFEFTRCMDHSFTMDAALVRKAHQYDEAVDALSRAQANIPLSARTVTQVHTVPMIFGVRGAVAYAEACQALQWFKLSQARQDKILAQGVREAITGASDLCTARFEALRKIPAAPRLPNGRRQRVIIPPKPYRPSEWRADRGGGAGLTHR